MWLARVSHTPHQAFDSGAEGLVIKPLMSVAGTSETSIKHQPLSVHEEVVATRNAPYKEEKALE
jgi:hypothetical protein